MRNWWRVVFLLVAVVLAGGLAKAQTRYGFHKPKTSPQGAKVATVETERKDATGGTNPTRWSVEATESGNRKTETQVLETLGVDGRYEATVEVEQETIQMDAQTARVVRRLFARDPDGRRKLIELTEEEQQHLGTDRQRVVSTTSKATLDGRMQVTRKEIQEASRLDPQTTQTKTSILQPSLNGSLRPVEQVTEIQEQKGRDVVEVRRTQLLPDGNGRWEPYQTVEQVIRKEGDEVRTEEELHRRDANGRLSLAERTVSREWSDEKGAEHQVTEVYSTNIAGTTRDGDGRIQLDRRMTVTRTGRPDGSQQTTQEMEQRSLVAPNEGLQVTERVLESSKPAGPAGTETQKRVQARDPGARYRTFIVLQSKSTKQ